MSPTTEVRRFLTSRPSRVAGGLHDVLALKGDLADDIRVRRRPGHPCVLLDRSDGRVDVLLGDRTLTVPARIRPALEEIRTRETLRIADLDGLLDPQSRLVLCRRPYGRQLALSHHSDLGS